MISKVSSNPDMFWPNTNRYLANKTQNTSFADTLAANSVNGQNSVRTGKLYSDPDFTFAPQEPGGGCMSISIVNMLISVYKSENYSEDNPVMRVKGINTDETHYEVEVNINDINPRSASLIELAALEGYNAANEKGLPVVSSVAMALSTLRISGNTAFDDGHADAFTKLDFIPAFQEMMETQRFQGNWDGYMRYKHIIDSLLRLVRN
jgi:hypothetical protein